MDLYTEKINEFTDWVNGTNYLTKRIDTLGDNGEALKVSGGSIRNLLQEKLRRPIYAEEGSDNMIRLFSSEEACNIWHNADDEEDYKDDLVLFEFATPSQYKIELSGLANGEVRHIIEGDRDQTYSKVIFNWAVKLGDEYQDDSIAVTYKVENSQYITPKTKTEIYTNRLETVNYDLYDYLTLGTNNITVTIKGLTTGANSSYTFQMIVVSLSITSTFSFYSAFGNRIAVPYRLIRNDYQENVNIKAYVNGTLVQTQTKFAGDRSDTGEIVISNTPNALGIQPYSSSIVSLNNAEKNRIHNLQLQAETTYDGVKFVSNLLSYDFVVASNETVANTIILTAIDFTSTQALNSPFSDITILATQFQPVDIPWAYYTDRQTQDTSVDVLWQLLKGEGVEALLIPLSTIEGNKGRQSSTLSFIPTVYSEDNSPVYLNAYIRGNLVRQIPMIIQQSSLSISETGGADIKLSAYGKTNQSTDKDQWIPEGTQATVTFSSGIRWDDQQGWYNNSLRLSGTDCYATLDYNPFSYIPGENEDDTKPQATGRTIELEFEVEKTVSEDDVVILVGGSTGARIEIKPSEAILYDANGTQRILTNYKDNERVKIAFILNGSQRISIDRNLVYIVTNGILERAAKVQGFDFSRNSGNIKIGGSRSGVKFYSLRVYEGPISYTDAYNNYAFDSEDKAIIAANNNIFDQGGNISYEDCRNKIDTILIVGNLTDILSAKSDKDKSETDVTISRHCPSDTTKDFTCTGCRIRKHGQSTLFYPITSMKFWLNKSVSGNTPIFVCEDQKSLGLAKNRYKMKDDSIPANKFVLQANYADSSGVHNGGLLRLILNSWYNARISSQDNKFLLRTEPQLFTSIDPADKGSYGLLHVWKDYSGGKEFPYKLEIGADSFPCVVFYQNTADDNKVTYLGQYVFMEDKKSDFNYGERSIYKADPKDPFCLTTANKKADTDNNKVWDNSNVLRIEVVNVNTPFVSYMSNSINGVDFMDIVEPVASSGEEEEEDVPEILKERHYRWEEDFELIYPDPEDVEGRPVGYYINGSGQLKYQDTDTTKFANPQNSEFVKKTKPFVDWYRWLVSTYQNPTKFREEAADHLDLYKLAAYYVFFMRFGLVDSVERNALLKTYDGVHWHYEPWDMDIALGNRNTGGIAFNPPIDRDTKMPGDDTSWALSGKSSTTSNWLWDALEDWPTWKNGIVKQVADALHSAGLTYAQCIDMFDNNYAKAWSEMIYNKSGYFKYVESGDGSEQWLAWLQGARTTHRHWWLSTSMDFYDAKWGVGDYVNHFIHYRGTHAINDPAVVQVQASKETYFSLANDTSTLSTQHADTDEVINFNLTSEAVTERNNLRIYGAKNIESFKLGGLADGLGTLTVSGAYSDVLGACIKSLDIGTTLTKVDDYTYTGSVNVRTGGISFAYKDGNKNALQILQDFNLRGQYTVESITPIMFDDLDENSDLSSVHNIYALGSGLQLFYSSYRGNVFDMVELPSTVTTLYMRNSSWNTIEFWDTATPTSTTVGLVDEHNEPIINPDTNQQETVTKNTTTITKHNYNNDYSYNIPSTLTNVSLLGSTGRYKCSKDFVLSWINSIIALSSNGADDLANYNLTMDSIQWDSTTCGNDLLTFDELALIAKLNGLADEEDETLKATKRQKLRGYIILKRQPNNNDLTVEQLSQIRSWFGDTVFSLSSIGSGLVIDYAYAYSQISIGSPAYNESGNFYIKEGNNAALNITTFHLQESISDNPWYINVYNGSTLIDEPRLMYKGVSISKDDEGIYRIYVGEGDGTPYKVFIYTTEGLAKVGVDLNIVPVSYPSNYTFHTEYYTGTEDRSVGNNIVMYSSSNAFETFLRPVGTFDATISDVVFSISCSDSLISSGISTGISYKQLPSTAENIDSILKYEKSTSTDANNKYGIKIFAYDDLPDQIRYYTLTASIRFKNSTNNTTASVTIAVLNDNVALITSTSGSLLYAGIADSYETEFGGTAPLNFYKTTLMAMTTVSFDKASLHNINSIKTLIGDSVLLYLTNVENLSFKGCTLLTSTITGVNLLDFSNMANLEVLDITDCSSLTADIDLSSCTNLEEVDASGTSVNITIPTGSKVTKYELGVPTEVSIIDPTVLQPSGVVVDNAYNITSLDVRNIPNNKTYTMFGKIMLNITNPNNI